MNRQSTTFFIVIFFSLLFTVSIYPQVIEKSENLNRYFSIDTISGSKMGNSREDCLIDIHEQELISGFLSRAFLVIECEQENSVSGMAFLEFYKKNEKDPSLRAKIGLLPNLRSYLVFPTEYLNAQQIFLPRYPRQLKGVVFGSRIHSEDLARISIYSSPGLEDAIRVYNIFLSDKLPDFQSLPYEIFVDSLGQWRSKRWKNKIETISQWEKHSGKLKSLATSEQKFPEEFSSYGGWKKVRFDSTGFFHTHHDGTRWWFVDPEGYAFLSFGMDCVGPDEPGILSGNEQLFEYLPPEEGEYRSVYGTTRGMKTINFFKLNMIRIFGRDWFDPWVKISVNKLVSSYFNTVGNWADKRFMIRSGLPYVLPMSDFPSTEVLLYRDFPDVFSPEFRVKARVFASQLKPYKDDPNMIGYFLRNEPQWAFGNNDLAFELLASGKASFTRAALVRWLEDKYQSSDSLSVTWNIQLTNFSDLQTLTLREYPSENCRADLWEFSKRMVREYVQVVSEETRRVAPNHLNLGMRYAYISSDLLYTAGEFFDVFSINGYNYPAPPPTAEIFERSGKPVLIGEFHFGATDRGLPSTGLRGVKDQKERGKAYRYFLENGFSRPEIIGIHYFQWLDQSVIGRFDGENYNIGFNDVIFQSYEELVRQARKAHKNAYPVAKGERKAYKKLADEVPAISF